MKRSLWMTLGIVVAAVSSPADVVVQRWGTSGHVQHPETLKYVEAGQAGKVVRFDLSSLPAGAKVYRARLLMTRTGGHGSSFEVFGARETVSGKVRFTDQALQPVPPYCRWFDVTASVRTWVEVGTKSASFLVRGQGYDPAATMLEIAHEGALSKQQPASDQPGQITAPPKQVSGIKAFCRSGQVFITFEEIEDLSEGKDRYPWGDLIKKLRGYNADGPIPRDQKRELRYRVYRHGEPITPKSIGAAELLAELVGGSGFNTRMVRRIWQGENRPSKLDDSFIAVRLAVEPKKPLPSGTGLYVHTVTRPGKAYYAVVTAVNGVENTTDLSPANVAGPIEQAQADPEPVLQSEELTPGAYNRKADDLITRRYCYWAVPPLSPRPLQYGFVLQWYPNRIAKPAALEYSHGMAHPVEPNLARRQRRDAILLAGSCDPENGLYLGANNCHTTLKSYRQGTWGPWTYNRAARWIAWVRRNFEIDEQEIYCYGSHWGLWELRHPELFSVFIGWGSGELTRGFVDWNRANGVWGPPEAFAGKPDEENPYVMCDMTRYVSADPARRLPVQFLIPCTGSHTSEMSYAALPRYKGALRDARQPFAAAIGKASWGFAVPVALREFQAGRLKILRDQSKPAFANCTLDDNPGSGDIHSGDPTGMLNGYLLWESETLVDEPGRWEMTVYLHESAPLAECKVDLTPRHCQKFKPAPGQDLRWTNTGAGGGKGTVKADQHGLVTLPALTVTKSKNRIAIEK